MKTREKFMVNKGYEGGDALVARDCVMNENKHKTAAKKYDLVWA